MERCLSWVRRTLRLPAGVLWWGALIGAVLACLGPPSTAHALVTNAGGVFILHAPGDGPWEPGDVDPCDLPALERWDLARTRLSGDGKPRLIVLYAAFPAESTAEVAGTCFGIDYSQNVKVWASGACNSGGFEMPNDGWPKPGSGNSVGNQPFKLARKGKPISIYWFAVSAKGPGFFEATPNPGQNFGGKFGNTDALAYLEPISGYGKIGFDLAGSVPEPGRRAVRGACCTDACWPLAEIECAFFKGIFLGPGSDCANEPCGPTPLKGACCLPAGCEMFSLLDCARLHGVSLGEGVHCGAVPCPSAEAGDVRSTPPAGEGRPQGSESGATGQASAAEPSAPAPYLGALREFQRGHGLKETGELDDATVDQLLAAEGAPRDLLEFALGEVLCKMAPREGGAFEGERFRPVLTCAVPAQLPRLRRLLEVGADPGAVHIAGFSPAREEWAVRGSVMSHVPLQPGFAVAAAEPGLTLMEYCAGLTQARGAGCDFTEVRRLLGQYGKKKGERHG